MGPKAVLVCLQVTEAWVGPPNTKASKSSHRLGTKVQWQSRPFCHVVSMVFCLLGLGVSARSGEKGKGVHHTWAVMLLPRPMKMGASGQGFLWPQGYLCDRWWLGADLKEVGERDNTQPRLGGSA